MSKAIGWIVIGSVLGVLATWVLQPSPVALENSDNYLTSTGLDRATVPGLSFHEIEDLENRMRRLESRIDELEVELREEGRQRATGSNVATAPEGAFAVERATTAERYQGIAERLIAGGFAPDRARWIESRSEELVGAQIEALYRAQAEGSQTSSMEARDGGGLQNTLREELGDWEYEQYLQALGESTSVGVAVVFEDSPAARAGLMSGDQIVAYGGTRVFNSFELTQLTREGAVGQSVLVDIVRDGQSMQIVVPRGPLEPAFAKSRSPVSGN